MTEDSKPVKIVSSVPALSVDGHGLAVDPATGNANLLFVQIAINQQPETQEILEGNAVASIRLSKQQLQRLSDDLIKALQQVEKLEKEDKK